MKILVVEDEQDLRETIRTSLLKEKFVVETAADYHSAFDKINDYDSAGHHAAGRKRSGPAA